MSVLLRAVHLILGNHVQKTLRPCLLLLAIILLPSTMTPSHAAETLQAAGVSSPPYYFEQDGQVVGSDAEIVRFLLDNMGVDYELSVMSQARLELSLQNGDVDLAISIEDTDKIQTLSRVLKMPTRNSEFVLITNKSTKEQFNATSLQYVQANGLTVGITNGEPYNDQFWDLFPWVNEEKTAFNDGLDVATHDRHNLLKLERERIDVFPADRISALYQAKSLKLQNIDSYDFVLFFKPLFFSTSRNSTFSDSLNIDIGRFQEVFETKLKQLQELPEYFRITNLDINTDIDKLSLDGVTLADEHPIGKTINVGFLAALTGPDSGWGEPGLTGNQMFIDRVNAEGGLLVKGVRHPLKMYIFDDEADSNRALAGAKVLVDQYDVKFISAIGGAAADAVHPYLTQEKVVYASLIATDIKPDRPYLLAGGDVTPRIDMLRPWYHKNKNPELKRWAVVSQNDPIGRACQAWEVGAAVAEGWEVVYDKHFPVDETNFRSVVQDILQSKPDVVSLNLTWPDFVKEILFELERQGFKGEISGNYMDVEANLASVSQEFHENAVDSFPLFDDPYWGQPSAQHSFFQEWMSRHGPGAPQDLNRTITGIDWDHVIMLEVWAYGAQLAESFDPDNIIDALRNEPLIPTLLGKAKMTGEVMWGIKNMVSPPIPINETRGGTKRIQTIKLFDEWFSNNRDTIISVVQEKGHYWQ